MVWRVGARVHALVHGLFKPSEAELVRQQWDELADLFRQVGISNEQDRQRLIAVIAEDVAERLDIAVDHDQAALIRELTERLFNYEGLFLLPEVDWSQPRTIAELWDIREELTRQRGFIGNFEDNCDLITRAITDMVEPIYTACPALLGQSDDTDGISVPTNLLQSIGNLGTVTQAMLGVAFAEELAEQGLLARLSDRLERNLVAVSGGNPADPRGLSTPS